MNSFVYILIFLISIFISSCSQIALKKSANKKHKTRVSEIINPVVLGAYVFFLGSSFLTVFAYKGVDLSWGPVLETTSYIYIMCLGAIFLKERITIKKIIGNIIIILGIIVYAFGG